MELKMFDKFLEYFMSALFGLFIILVILSPLIIYGCVKNEMRIMQQCIDDGNKEYECEALLRRGRR